MQPSHKHHTPPQAASPSAASPPAGSPPASGTSPDIVIPQPNTAPAPGTTTPATEVAPRPVPAPVPSLSSTQIVVAAALVLVWAGVLLFARRVLTQSLVAQFADLEKARGAGTTLYLFLLALGATVIVCLLGSFWTVLTVVVPAGVLDAVLLLVFLFSLGAARASRQRR